MTHRHHTGPWAHPARRDTPPEVRALRCMKWACLIALVALMAVIAAQNIVRGWNEAIHSSLNYEVIRG